LINDWNCEIVCGCKKAVRSFIDLSTTLYGHFLIWQVGRTLWTPDVSNPS
jgi:hypothetical protein